MYHVVKITKQDQHTYQFLWRDMDDSKKLDTYVLVVVSFWDQPAGHITTMALPKIVEMNNRMREVSTRGRYDLKQHIC